MAEPTRSVAVFEVPKDRATNLRCVACVDRACESLGSVPGVLHVECDTAKARIEVEYDSRVSSEEIERRLADLDLEFSQTLVHRAWRVSGLD